MNRILRGAVILAASALALGCNTEPEETEGGTPTAIVADPEVIFVQRGDSQAVLVRLVDQQGTSLNSPISISGVVAPISVSIDSLFRPIFASDGTLIANTNGTELRMFVRGDALGATEFTVNAEGLSDVVRVVVTPTEIAPTVSNAAPSIAEPVTVTAEAGLTFTTYSQLVDAAGTPIAYTIGVAPDGTSMTVLFVPGFSGPYTITDVVPAYAPALTVDLPSTTAVTVAATFGTGLTGVDALATAPVLTPLSSDVATGVVDVGTSFPGPAGVGDGTRLYKLIVEEAGTYAFTISWDGGKDLAVTVYDESGAFTGIIGDAGGLNDDTESTTGDLEVGVYYVAAEFFDYGANPLPNYIKIDVAAE